jgi:V/A-type H+-transporting ATPase subunit I
MSIVKLMRVTLIGHLDDKRDVLSQLQRMGCLHVIPLAVEGAVAPEQGPTPEARQALKFLLTCRRRRRQVKDARTFDPVRIEQTALDLQRRLEDLEDERDALLQRLSYLEPWGDFALPEREDLAGRRLWFYIVPHPEMRRVPRDGVAWQVVHRDNRFCYLVAIGREEPKGMPVPRTHTGSKSIRQLEGRLDEVELAIEDIEAERSSLSRWLVQFANSLHMLEDRAALARVSGQTYDSDQMFGLRAWVPHDQVDHLREFAAARAIAFQARPPEPGESPPTLLRNPPKLAAGEDLVTFYMTPGYWTWDPSAVVLFSFAVFFAMIISDAGYAAVLALVLLGGWRTWGRSASARRLRAIFATVVATSIAYGVVAGSYFGAAPSPQSLLGRLKVLDVTDSAQMMVISVVIGVLHLVVGNLLNAWRLRRQSAALAPLGWACAVIGGLLFLTGGRSTSSSLEQGGVVCLATGLLLVLLFSGAGEKPLKRGLAGLLALARLTSAFGDVLSYLRLFALGLATASLAVAFNDLAGQVRHGVPGAGLFLALLVLVVGHGLNFVLGLMSAVVHGLRLNVIEFFSWGVPEEGHLFRPLKQKERMPWNPSS